MQLRTMAFGTGLALMVSSATWAAEDGAAVYRSQCAACHGETGKSETAAGKAMEIPPLAGNAGVAAMSDAEIVASIKGAAKHPPKTKEMAEDDLAAVAAHVRKLAEVK